MCQVDLDPVEVAETGLYGGGCTTADRDAPNYPKKRGAIEVALFG